MRSRKIEPSMTVSRNVALAWMTAASFATFAMVAMFGGARAFGDGTTTTTAVYEVPGPADLALYSQFLIPNVTTTVTGQQISFSYDLPAELVGSTPVAISLAGTIVPGQNLQISGERGTGTCAISVDHAAAVCEIHYRNLGNDPKAAADYLSSSVKNPDELNSRMKVATFFGSEPVGIVTYPIWHSP